MSGVIKTKQNLGWGGSLVQEGGRGGEHYRS